MCWLTRDGDATRLVTAESARTSFEEKQSGHSMVAPTWGNVACIRVPQTRQTTGT